MNTDMDIIITPVELNITKYDSTYLSNSSIISDYIAKHS